MSFTHNLPQASSPPDHDPERPQTARPPSSPDFYYNHHDPQYTFSQQSEISEELEEDDEESEDEGVFAYLPPTTAEVQANQQAIRQQETSYPERPQTQHGSRPFTAMSFGATPAFHHQTHTHTDSYPSTVPPVTPFSNIPIDTPPSTNSHTNGEVGYRLERIEPSPPQSGFSGSAASRVSVPVGSTRGLRVELPPPDMPSPPLEKEKELEHLDLEEKDLGKMRPASVESTEIDLSISPSVLDFSDVESRESVK